MSALFTVEEIKVEHDAYLVSNFNYIPATALHLFMHQRSKIFSTILFRPKRMKDERGTSRIPDEHFCRVEGG